MLLPSMAFSLGLGELTLESALNQPFKAKIELSDLKEGELDNLSVSLASVEEHEKTGIDRPAVLSTLKFSVRMDGDTPVISVVSEQPVTEPILNFLLDVVSAKSHHLREYAVFLDPVVLPVNITTNTATPVITQAEATNEAAPSVSQNESAGATAGATVVDPKSEWLVARGDTLWDIALKLRPDTGLSVDQYMVALFRANPDAFFRSNPNNLMEGFVLRTPAFDEVDSISYSEAQSAMNGYNEQWRLNRVRSASSVGTGEGAVDRSQGAEDSGAATEQQTQTTDAASDDGVLRLVRDGQQVVDGESGEQQQSTSDATAQNTLLSEELDAKIQENADLKERISDLEGQVEKLNKLLEIQSQDLATLTPSPDAGAEITPEPSQETAPVAVAPSTAEPETPVAAPALIDRLLENKIAIAIAAAGLGLLGLLMARRRKSKDAEEPAPTEIIDLNKQETTPEGTVSSIEELEVSSPDKSFITPVVEEGALDVDPVAEAEVYMTYGRYDQAEDILTEAINKDDDRVTTKLKLLEVFYLQKQVTKFEQLTSELSVQCGDDLPEKWDKVVAWGYELNPANELFSAGASAATTDNDDIDIVADEAILDIDLDDDSVVTDAVDILIEDFNSQTSSPLTDNEFVEDIDIDSDISGESSVAADFVGLNDPEESSIEIDLSDLGEEADLAPLDIEIDMSDSADEISFEMPEIEVEEDPLSENFEIDSMNPLDIEEPSVVSQSIVSPIEFDETSAVHVIPAVEAEIEAEGDDDLAIRDDDSFNLEDLSGEFDIGDIQSVSDDNEPGAVEALEEESGSFVDDVSMEFSLSDLEYQGLKEEYDKTMGDDEQSTAGELTEPPSESDQSDDDLFDEASGFDLDLSELSTDDDSLIELDIDELDLGPDPLDVEDESVSTIDAVATKLDLMRAYVEMGNIDEAQKIYEDVLAVGNEAQKKQASDFYSEINPE